MTLVTEADAPPAEAGVLEALLAARYSCRAFRPDPVPQATLASIFRLAQRSASWCNTQPWHVTVTSGAETEAVAARLYAHAEAGGATGFDLGEPVYEGTSLARRQDLGRGLYRCLGIGRGDEEARRRQMLDNYRFFGAPHMALVTTDRNLGPYGVCDCGSYLSTLMLAARAHGVDTLPQGAVARYSAILRDVFGVPEDRAIVCGVAIGYADPAEPVNNFRTERAGISEAVTWRGFDVA